MSALSVLFLLHKWIQCMDGFTLLLQRYVRKGNDAKNPAILSFCLLPLMLWRAEKTRDDVVGNSGQGIYWQGSDITHRPDETHRMGGLGTWRHAEGVPHACTARRTLLLEKITWGQVNPAREQMSLPWRGSSTGLKGCRRQQFPALKRLLKFI